MGVVMVYSSRKVVVGYVDTHSGRSVGHYGLYQHRNPLPYGRGFHIYLLIKNFHFSQVCYNLNNQFINRG